MDFKEFEPLFGKWADKFRPFIESEEFYNIYQKLKADSRIERIVPQSDNVFKAFQKTTPDNIKCVFYLMDPYPRLYRGKEGIPQATGVAMDCSNTPDGKLQPSLTKFYDAMSKELGEVVEYSPSLDYLLEQGVLLLNTDLTCKVNKRGSHKALWEPFQKFFLQEIMGGYSGIIYVLCGDESKRMRKHIFEMGNYVFQIEHPAAAEHNKRDWDSEGIFNKVNKLLLQNQGKASYINWNKKTYDLEPPF